MNGQKTTMYRAMIYAAVASFHFYRKDFIPMQEGETYGDLAKKNQKVVDRVFEEVQNLFDYELSSDQIGSALKMYTSEGISVDNYPASRIDEHGKVV